jgi:hypothetical protein
MAEKNPTCLHFAVPRRNTSERIRKNCVRLRIARARLVSKVLPLALGIRITLRVMGPIPLIRVSGAGGVRSSLADGVHLLGVLVPV